MFTDDNQDPVAEPEEFSFGKSRVTGLNWSGWGNDEATASGTLEETDCSQGGCSQGPTVTSDAEVSLTSIRDCGGQRQYTEGKLQTRTPDGDPYEGKLFSSEADCAPTLVPSADDTGAESSKSIPSVRERPLRERWNDGAPEWQYTIVVGSTQSRAEAEDLIDGTDEGQDYVCGVLRSDAYSSLAPGFWVSWCDHSSSAAGLQNQLEELQSAGFADAYVRQVSK